MSSTNGASRTSSSVGTHTVERFPPGAVVSVGTHKVEIVNYLADGGFAQIYAVKFIEYLNEFENKAKNPLKVGEVACLKRVLVQDENGLSEMRNEVEVMKQLMGRKNIVQYYDSNACRRSNGSPGFEVLLLMELCPNKSLLDYMNQRLATKLTEQEILKIMHDVSLAVAQMHYLNLPLIHRDIKIENVLVDADNNFKLCDFGSTSQCFPVVTTHQEIAILTQNIYVHTTPQYRCPEMIDLYRCLPINEKSDIWALGIFLYKLLFFTTPFEMTGQFAILHSKYEFPPNNYSSQLINLIIIMLAENPYVRPNIYQVLNHICTIMGVEVPIEDKYGAGPYNFQKYSEFQTRLQDTQYQMYVLQQKKLENGSLSQLEENLLNKLMIAAFEVSAKVPVEVDSRASSSTPEPHHVHLRGSVTSSTDELTERKSASLPEEPPVRTSSIKTTDKATPVPAAGDTLVQSTAGAEQEPVNQEISTHEAEASKGMQTKDATFANEYLQNNPHLNAVNLERQTSVSVMSSGGKSYVSGPQALGSEGAAEPNAKSDASSNIKQHKANNPFPRMAQGYVDPNNTENFFTNEASPAPQTQPLPQQAPYPKPVPENFYMAQKDGLSQNQRPQYTAQNTQQIRQPQVPPVQHNSYMYRPGDIPIGTPLGVPQQNPQQPQPFRQGQEVGGMMNAGMIYNHQNMPPQESIPYYTTKQAVNYNAKPQEPQPRPLGSLQAQANRAPASFEQGIPHKVSNKAQEEIPPPMPARRENLTRESSIASSGSVKKEDELLIEFSPSHQKGYVKQDTVSNKEDVIKSQRETNKHGSLDLSYNEMDLSQEDIAKTDTESIPLHTGGMDSNMASSESIDLDLDEARLGGRSRLMNRDDIPSRSFESPAPRRRDFRKEELAARENESESEREVPARRSLDLQYHEIHFSSPDLNGSNVPNLTNHHKSTSGKLKQRAGRHLHKKTPESSDGGSHSGPHISRNKRETPNGGSTSANRKHSTNSSGGPRTTAQVKSDLEKYKAENSSSSSISLSVSTSSLSNMRRSFNKARQSLDLERVRRETLNNSEGSLNATSGKRRSLFSVFKGGNADKK